MATTFARWTARMTKLGLKAIPHVAYVCGSERALIDEVVADVRRLVDPPDYAYSRLTAGEISDRAIWEVVNRFSLATTTRLIQISDAQCIKDWEPYLANWLTNQVQWYPNDYLLFISSAEKPPEEENLRSAIIECKRPSDEMLIHWIQGKCPGLGVDAAGHLLTRTGYDLIRVANVCAKLVLFPGPFGNGVVDDLCEEEPLDVFVESLLMLDRRSATLAAATVPAYSLGRVVGLLDSRLDAMGSLKATMGARELAAFPGLPVSLAKNYVTVVKDYDSNRILRRRKVLNVIDEAINNGARVGVLESLCALW